MIVIFDLSVGHLFSKLILSNKPPCGGEVLYILSAYLSVYTTKLSMNFTNEKTYYNTVFYRRGHL